MSHCDEERGQHNEKKAKTGRPPVQLTDEQIAEVKTLAAVLNTEQIADYLGISHVTFKAIRDRDERVSFAYKNGKAKAIASVGGNLLSQAREGNTAAIIFYLKTQAGWKETVKVDQKVTQNIMPVPTADSVESWEEIAQKQQESIKNG